MTEERQALFELIEKRADAACANCWRLPSIG